MARNAFRAAVLAAAALSLVPTATHAAQCHLSKYVDIPVTMAGRRPVVTTQINGRDARFILDSGAFFSTIAKANALEYGLSIRELGGGGARLKGIGGDSSLGVTTAKEFRIANIPIPRIEFAVGGSDTGYAGLIGQNILGLADVEYDLPHGFVRLMKGQGCRGEAMAYWAGTKPMTLVQLEPMGVGQHHTIGTVHIDGKPIRAVFDTGAEGSMLTLAAAKRLGMAPGDDAHGYSYGLGQKRVRSWRMRFASIDIGGEAIAKPWIEVADDTLDGPDMLIGIDFFLTHRIYVDNQNHRMFITYEGGPMFGLNPKGAVDNKGKGLDLTDHSGEPTTALGYSQRGAILATNGRFDNAIADFDKAVALAPADPHYLYQRAMARLGNHQPLLGAADLDRAIALVPNDAEAHLARARLRLGAHDQDGAMADLKVADAALAPSSDMRKGLASMYDAAGVPEAGLASWDAWLKSHPEDNGRATAFNGRCWARALMNTALDKALADCDSALRLHPGEAAYLDSRALVRLRRGEWDRALADYDAALAVQPRNAWSLYARAIVEQKLGKAAQADSDRAKAFAIDPHVEDRAKRYHVGA
ncbi:aspartyl protease family protein [Sphingomonas sp. CROZ-RG-20F-R02-07]|uniref:aspartyl protease family protein n=1 Tax=Sphingomonas sp. CROZ-RG-20F-R02-07 TaxID=2914832 RepID=UPI001F5A3F2E